MILSCTTLLFPPPGLSSMDTETAVVADCIDPDLEVVWQLKQKDKVRMVLWWENAWSALPTLVHIMMVTATVTKSWSGWHSTVASTLKVGVLPMFIAALLTIAKHGSNLNVHQWGIGWRRCVCVCVCVWNSIQPLKRTQQMPFSTWMDLEIAIQSEVSQTQKLYDITYMWNLKSNDTNKPTKQRLTDLENERMVTRRKRRDS